MSLERANQLRDLGRWAEAEAAYASVLAADPDNDDARAGYGLTLAARGLRAQARDEFSRVLARTPEHVMARYHRALGHAADQQITEAVADLDYLIDHGGQDFYLWADRGGLRLQGGDIDGGVRDMREAFRRNPQHPSVRYNLAAGLAMAERFEEAYGHAAAAADAGLDRGHGLRERLRAIIGDQAGPDQRERWFDALVATSSEAAVAALVEESPALLAPQVIGWLAERAGGGAWLDELRRMAASAAVNGRSRRPMATTRLPVGGDREAVRRLDELAERLQRLQQSGRLDEAAALMPEILDLARGGLGEESVEYGIQLLNLAVLAGMSQDWATAVPAYQEASTLLTRVNPPAFPPGAISFANVLSEAGHPDQARKVFDLVLPIVVREPLGIGADVVARFARGFGNLLIDSGELEYAEAMLTTLSLNPAVLAEGAEDAQATVLTYLGEAVLAAGRPAEALAIGQRALAATRRAHGDLSQRVAGLMRGVGRLHRANGQLTEALTWLRRAIGIGERLAGAAADPAELQLTRSDLAETLAEAGELTEARAVAAGLRATLEAEPASAGRELPAILQRLGNAYRTLGDTAGEEWTLRRSDPVLRSASELNTLADVRYRMDQFDEAVRLYREALETLEATDPDSTEAIAIVSHNLANAYSSAGRRADAVPMHERAIAGLRQVCPAGDARLVSAMLDAVGDYHHGGRPEDAAALFAEVTRYLPDLPDLQDHAAEVAADLSLAVEQAAPAYVALTTRATELSRTGDIRAAVPLWRQALRNALQALGPDHLDVGAISFNLAVQSREIGQTAGTVELLRDALRIRVAHLPEDDERVHRTRLELADAMRIEGDPAGAAELAETLLPHLSETTKPVLAGRARTVAGIAAQDLGRMPRAERHLRRAIELADTVGEATDRVTARRNLALLLMGFGTPSVAADVAGQALELAVREFGPDDLRTVEARLTRAQMLWADGRSAESDSLARQALEQLDRLGRPEDDPARGTAYNVLSLVAYEQGRPRQAAEWAQRAAAVAGPGPEATLLYNQALMRFNQADFGPARDLAEAAARAAGHRNPGRLAAARALLGTIDVAQGRPDTGIPLISEAIQAIETDSGDNDSRLILPMTTLAAAYLNIGARDTAHHFAANALRLGQRVYGEDSPRLAGPLLTLSRCVAFRGDTTEAIRLATQAVLRDQHGADTVRWLGHLQAAGGDRPAALDSYLRAAAIQDELLPELVGTASERSRTAVVTHMWGLVEDVLTLVLQPDDGEIGTAVSRKCWELVTRRRGLTGEYLRHERAAARRVDRPQIVRLLRELAGVRAELARATQTGDETRGLAERRAELESLLAATAGPPPGMPSPDEAIPSDATYLEYVRYRVTDVRNLALGEAAVGSDRDPLVPVLLERYAAFVIGSGHVHLIDLGDAGPVDEAAADLRAALKPSASTKFAVTWDDAGQSLRRLLYDPVRHLIEPGRDRLLVVTDGALDMVPLQILPVDAGRRLVDAHPISYLSSARELSRRGLPSTPDSDPLVLGDPDYDLGGSGVDRIVDPLPETGMEADEIGQLLSVAPMTGDRAVKALLEAQHSPRLMHLATHGLYLAAPAPPEPSDYYPSVHIVSVPGEGNFLAYAEPPSTDETRVGGLPGADADPLLRSAVALAGFNTWASGENPPPDAGNGLLTADDVCALDLAGTRLVVLSACDTGLGDSSGAEGVLGLRWALGVAGTQTVVTSLWKVPDQATRRLMVAFYRRLLHGAPVAAALRSAQEEVRKRQQNPWFWGAFVVHGDPGVTIR